VNAADAISLASALQGNRLIQTGLPISLFIIMVGVGLTLRLRDFGDVVFYPHALILGTITQMLLMPAVGFALAWLLQLPPPIAVGLVIIAACPGGTTSNVFAFLAKGNLALSILMTASASLLTILTLPLLANWAIALFTDNTMDEPLRLPVTQTIAMLLAIVFVPVMLGMGLRAWKTQLTGRLEGAVGAFGMLVLFALVVLIVVQTRDHLGELVAQAGPAVFLLNLLGVAAGFAIARIVGHNFVDGLTLALELGIKNSTIGLTVTLTLLASADIAMPAALYGLLMFASAGALVVIGRRHDRVGMLPARDELPMHVPDDVGVADQNKNR